MKKINSTALLVFFSLWFFISVIFTPIQNASQSMRIEVLPPQPTSSHNFTVSVYDSTIVNDTPYLTNVKIVFQDENYTITDQHPNREIVLVAPTVFVPTVFTIYAYKESYNSTNLSITINPASPNPNHLVITQISSSLKANDFFILKVTDEFNSPIQNATVSIQDIKGEGTDGITNKTGFITLKAPNQREIVVLAQKEGFREDTITLWVEIKEEFISEFLSDPLVPIVIALCILIITILFVGFKNKQKLRKHKNKTKNKFVVSKYRSTKKTREKKGSLEKNVDEKVNVFSQVKSPMGKSSKVEEIQIEKPFSQEETISINSKKNNIDKNLSFHQHWFSEQNSIEEKVDQIISKQNPRKNKDDWFKGATNGKMTINKTINKKKKKSKSK